MGEVLTTIVGIVTGLILAFVSSYVIPLLITKREKAERKRDIYERYAQPLAADSANLLWRFNEILFGQRAHYLREDAPATPYNEYKVISTCYRIAVLLGWIRAIRLEQSYLLFGDEATFDQVREAVTSIEIALADSPPVEIETVNKLARLWGIELPSESEKVNCIAAEVSAELQHLLAECRLTRYEQFVELEESQRRRIVRIVADAITRKIHRQPLAEPHISETCAEALAYITVKQAWIYREWQQAIGNLMIREVTGAVRRFDIVGYEDFEKTVRDGESEKRVLLMRLRDMVVGIDLARPAAADYRLTQLRLLASAVARLICAIEKIQFDRKILDERVCAMANTFIIEETL